MRGVKAFGCNCEGHGGCNPPGVLREQLFHRILHVVDGAARAPTPAPQHALCCVTRVEHQARRPHAVHASGPVPEVLENLGEEAGRDHVVHHAPCRKHAHHVDGAGDVQGEVVGRAEQVREPLPDLIRREKLGVQRGEEDAHHLPLAVVPVHRDRHRLLDKMTVVLGRVQLTHAGRNLLDICAGEVLLQRDDTCLLELPHRIIVLRGLPDAGRRAPGPPELVRALQPPCCLSVSHDPLEGLTRVGVV
mmetsp:Transcript_58766/g.187542  ORF Transcript_58766/g.187542 Transcript_58766/m.187542 type:complete len:247 (+) Transcript_58766:2000-2740(+)